MFIKIYKLNLEILALTDYNRICQQTSNSTRLNFYCWLASAAVVMYFSLSTSPSVEQPGRQLVFHGVAAVN